MDLTIGSHVHIYPSGVLVTGQHTKPTLAFIALAVVAAAMIGSQYRAGDGRGTAAAGSPSRSQTSVVNRAEPAEELAVSEHRDATSRTTRTSRGGTEREQLPPVESTASNLEAQHQLSPTDAEAGQPKKGSHPADNGRRAHGEPAC